MVDDGVHLLRPVVLQADDRRPEHADPVGLELGHEAPGVHPCELPVVTLLSLDPHPDPTDPQPYELVDRIRPDDARRAEDVKGPALALGLHQLQEPQRPFAMEEEVLI